MNEAAPANSGDDLGRDRLAADLRGFGPIGIVAVLVILAGILIAVPFSAVLVLLWVKLSHTPWREIGYARPRSWVRTVAAGIVFGVAFKLVMKALVMPLLGAPPINPAYHFIAGNTAALPAVLALMIVGAGFGEETVFRGYLFQRLGTLFGRAVWVKPVIVLSTAAFFALLHFHDQGIAGVEQATVTGLAFGTIFAITGRIWMVMVAHAAFDVTAVAMIYGNLESAVAHIVFN